MWPFWCRFSFCVPEILQEKETGESVRGKEAVFVEEITGVGVYSEVRTTQTPGKLKKFLELWGFIYYWT